MRRLIRNKGAASREDDTWVTVSAHSGAMLLA
jgi:hypothetical protein